MSIVQRDLSLTLGMKNNAIGFIVSQELFITNSLHLSQS